MRFSFYGLYKGWVANSEYYWNRHLELGMGHGQDLREALTSLPQRIVEFIKGGGYKECFQTKDTTNIGKETSQIINEAYERAKSLDITEINSKFSGAILDKDFFQAKVYLLAKVVKTGEITSEEEKALLDFDPLYQENGKYFDGKTLLFFDQLNIIKANYK